VTPDQCEAGRLAEASLRHTVSELQQRCADYELTLARREKELHDLEQRKAEEADMEYQKSRQMIDRSPPTCTPCACMYMQVLISNARKVW
jgi:hypothetical protein